MTQFADFGREVLLAEGQTLINSASRLGENFDQAVQLILDRRGKLVVTGLGKSGHVARKISASLSSTGTPSIYLHPSEALHGDLGVLQKEDALLAMAYSGETLEVLEVCQYARRFGVPIISITKSLDSSLGKLSSVWLDGSVEREACPLNLAPTTSSTLALALGDALAVALMKGRTFSANHFAQYHPAGSLGRKLSLVRDHMRALEDLSPVSEKASFHDVLEAITKRNFGVCPVTDAQGCLIGVVSDGDIRRSLMKLGGEALKHQAGQLMTPNPKVISSSSLAIDAVNRMENKTTSLFVVDDQASKHPPRLLGIIRLHDLMAAKIV